jgi:hypothetical protein
LLKAVKAAEELGAKCSVRNFWLHHDSGLVPQGRKIEGRGNRFFFQEMKPLRLYIYIAF